jgi:hypothetical protein
MRDDVLASNLSNHLCSVMEDAKHEVHRRLFASMPKLASILSDYAEEYLQEQFYYLLNKLVGGGALVIALPEKMAYQTYGNMVKYLNYEATICRISTQAETEVLAFLEGRYKELRESPTEYHYHKCNSGFCKVCNSQLKMIVDHTNLNAPAFQICFKCETIANIDGKGTLVKEKENG